MADIIASSATSRPLLRSESRKRMASGHLRKAENDEMAVEIGGVIEELRLSQGWSLKEFAGALQRSERQVARWISGQEHAQLGTIFKVKTLRRPLVVALAKLAGTGVEFETIIRIKEQPAA